MPDPVPQLLVSGRPIVCTRCMHGHLIDAIAGGLNVPTEYHCGYCGNFAIVGVPARWPFMEVVKGNSDFDQKVVREEKENAVLSSGSSPMQVGESLVKSRVNYSKNIPRNIPEPAQQAVITEEKTAEKCKPKQEERMNDFFKKYGMTEEEYKANKNYRLESPARVAKRLGKTGTEVALAAEAKPTKPEPEKRKPAPETKPPKEEPKAAPTETEKPRKAIGVIGKDFITIVCKDEFIERIKERADIEFRTPEQQVAYYLHKGMEVAGE